MSQITPLRVRARDLYGPVELVLSRLVQAKPANAAHTEWRALCPAHADHRPSLSIRAGDDGRALVHCHAGCPPEAVVAALGLTMTDLKPSRSSQLAVGSSQRKERQPTDNCELATGNSQEPASGGTEYLTEAARRTPCFQELGMPPVSLPAPQPAPQPDQAPHTPLPQGGNPKSEIQNPKEQNGEYLTEAARRTPCFRKLGMPPVSLPAPQPAPQPDQAPHTPLRPPRFYRYGIDALGVLERRHGPSDAQWFYTDATGEPVGIIARWNRPDGKDIRPVSRRPEGWVHAGMPEPRPLYRLPDLLRCADERVYVTEGEKAADAAWTLGVLATTSPHGSGSAAKADWTPLAGRDVALLPDNDEPGRKYARDVAELLLALTPPATVRIVDLPHLPPKGDIYDWLEDKDATETETMREWLDRLVEATEPSRAIADCGFRIADSHQADPPSSAALNQSSPAQPVAAGAEQDRPIPAPRPGVNPQSAIRNPQFPPRRCRPVLQCLADITPTPIEWLWPGRMALGRITVLVGRPGEGKSFLTTDMAARITTGRPWPDGQPTPAGSVLLISGEDGAADTIRGRVEVHGGDMSRVQVLAELADCTPDGRPYTRPFTLADVAELEDALQQHPDCRLMVVDPVGSFLGPATDSYRDSDVRALLVPVANLAERYGPAVLLVAHPRKSAGATADDQTMGSRAFTGLARAVWHLTHEAGNADRRLLLPGKNNLAARGAGLAFTIAGDPARIQWEPAPVTLTADEALRQENNPPEGGAGALQEAVAWLEMVLADGPLPSAEVLRLAKDEGIAAHTVRRAKDKLGIRSEKARGTATGGWNWSLPTAAASETNPQPLLVG